MTSLIKQAALLLLLLSAPLSLVAEEQLEKNKIYLSVSPDGVGYLITPKGKTFSNKKKEVVYLIDPESRLNTFSKKPERKKEKVIHKNTGAIK